MQGKGWSLPWIAICKSLEFFPSLSLEIFRPLNSTKGNGACLFTSAQAEAECARVNCTKAATFLHGTHAMDWLDLVQWPAMPKPGRRTISIVQDQIGQQFCPYREFSVVFDQSHCSEFVHEVRD